MILFLWAMTAFVSQPDAVLSRETPYQRTVAFLAQRGVAMGKAQTGNVCYLNGEAYSPGYTYKWCSGVNDPVTGCHEYSCITCKANGSWTPRQMC